ncbi:MAG: ABC-type branched-chain amino acid transport system, permease component, partial [uncultured bacterium]
MTQIIDSIRGDRPGLVLLVLLLGAAVIVPACNLLLPETSLLHIPTYGNPVLPDFMVFLNWQELPWFWHGFQWFWFAALMVVAAPAALAFIFGRFAFRSRVTGVYLSIITQAMTFALMLAFFRNEMGFGGNNGLTDFKDILGFSLQEDATRAGLFAASALALAAGYIACRFITGSRLGKACTAIRDQESRLRFIGYRVENVKLWVFTFSAAL